MFKVEDKTTGEIITVYALNGTHFLIYDEEHDWWLFKNIEECRPVADAPSREDFMEIHMLGGDRE